MLQSFRSWPSTNLMSFWLRKTLKSRNCSGKIKVKETQLYSHYSLCNIMVVFCMCVNPLICLHDCFYRIMVVSWRTPVRSRVDYGSVPQADAPADDGEKRAGHQTCAQPPRGPRQSTAAFFSFVLKFLDMCTIGFHSDSFRAEKSIHFGILRIFFV